MFLSAVSHAVAAQTQKVLLPVVIEKPIPGAFGSIWSTDVSVLSRGNPSFVIGGVLICHTGQCNFGENLVPNQTYRQPPIPMAAGTLGKFAIVPSDRLQDVTIDLRVVDLSRTSTSRGTHVPVVPESAAARTPIELLAIATGAPFRSLLRIYDFDPDPSHSVLVTAFRDNDGGDLVLDRRTLAFRQPPDPSQYPGYAELDLSYLATTAPEVRIEVAPASDGLRFWAMVSTTNNDTQHVTITSP
jgi:hypothetical protein